MKKLLLALLFAALLPLASFAQGPALPNDIYVQGLDLNAIARNAIGINRSNVVRIDPQGIGTTFGGNVTVDGTTTLTGGVTFAGNVAVTGTLQVTGASTFTGGAIFPSLSTANYFTYFDTASTIAGTSVFQLGTTAGGSTIFTGANPAVYLDETDQSALLRSWNIEVSGGALNLNKVSSTGAETNAIAIVGTGTTVSSVTMGAALYSATNYGSAAANGDITIEGTSSATKTTSYVILQPTAGNVGIGTTGPEAKLDVEAVRAAQVSLLQLGTDNSGGVTGDEVSVDFKYYSTMGFTGRISGYVQSTSGAGTGGLKFYTSAAGNAYNAAPSMTLNNSGNVGIGTSEPTTFKLQVLGGNIGFETDNAQTFGDATHRAISVAAINYNSGITAMTFTTSGSTALTLGTDQSATFVGNIIAPAGVFGTTPSTTGLIRMPNDQYLAARNATNNGNIGIIGLNASNQIEIAMSDFATIPTDVLINPDSQAINFTVYSDTLTALSVNGTTGATTFTGIVSAGTQVYMTALTTTAGALSGALCLATTGEVEKNTNAGGCLASSERFKDSIVNMEHGLDWVAQMQPVSWTWKDANIKQPTMGAGTAEAMARIDKSLATFDDEGRPYSLNDRGILGVLVNAIKQLDSKVIALEKRQ